MVRLPQLTFGQPSGSLNTKFTGLFEQGWMTVISNTPACGLKFLANSENVGGRAGTTGIGAGGGRTGSDGCWPMPARQTLSKSEVMVADSQVHQQLSRTVMLCAPTALGSQDGRIADAAAGWPIRMHRSLRGSSR